MLSRNVAVVLVLTSACGRTPVDRDGALARAAPTGEAVIDEATLKAIVSGALPTPECDLSKVASCVRRTPLLPTPVEPATLMPPGLLSTSSSHCGDFFAAVHPDPMGDAGVAACRASPIVTFTTWNLKEPSMRRTVPTDPGPCVFHPLAIQPIHEADTIFAVDAQGRVGHGVVVYSSVVIVDLVFGAEARLLAEFRPECIATE